jgi:hypothetical protein
MFAMKIKEKYIRSRVYRKGEASEEHKWRAQASSLVARFPDRVRIHFECSHVGKKEHHHFDYYRPWDVMLLCKTCHGVENARLHTIEKYQRSRLQSS